MYVSDIILDARATLGNCDEATVFRRLEDAVQLLTQKGLPDVTLGLMDICVCDGCVTLPREVGTVLAINTGGMTTLMRDQWFSFHMNGPGDEGCCIPCRYVNEEGEVTTFRDPHGPTYLVAVVENAQDNNSTLRVYGWDENNKRIYTTNPVTGETEDGFLIPTIFGFPVIGQDQPQVARIDRIQKSVTKGFVKLVAIDPDDMQPSTVIGYYEPGETNPKYRRIRVAGQNWIRLKYKKSNNSIRSTADWINVDNRQALLLALKVIRYRDLNQFDLSSRAEAEVNRALSEDMQSKVPPAALQTPQIMYNEFPTGNYERLFY